MAAGVAAAVRTLSSMAENGGKAQNAHCSGDMIKRLSGDEYR